MSNLKIINLECIIENISIRKPLERLLEMSHYTIDNHVTPLVLDFFTITNLGYSENYTLGKMESHYLIKSNYEVG